MQKELGKEVGKEVETRLSWKTFVGDFRGILSWDTFVEDFRGRLSWELIPSELSTLQVRMRIYIYIYIYMPAPCFVDMFRVFGFPWPGS